MANATWSIPLINFWWDFDCSKVDNDIKPGKEDPIYWDVSINVWTTFPIHDLIQAYSIDPYSSVACRGDTNILMNKRLY